MRSWASYREQHQVRRVAVMFGDAWLENDAVGADLAGLWEASDE